MSDKSLTLVATFAGAVVGGLAGYLFFTEQGRQFRRHLEPALDDIAQELGHFRGTVHKAAEVAAEGWKLLNEAFGEGYGGRGAYPRQTSPF